MPKIGLSKPYFANYSNNGENVAYTGGRLMGMAVTLNLALNAGGNSNDFYADNGVAESDGGVFTGGTVSLSTKDLLPSISSEILGSHLTPITGVEGLTTKGAQWEDYDDLQKTPFVGIAGIYMHQVDGAVKYQVVIFPKVKFTTPARDATTRGSTIQWQVDTLTAAVNRDDTVNHRWQRLSTLLDTEADAELLIKNFFGITDTPASGGGD